jgi:hypothetical protein
MRLFILIFFAFAASLAAQNKKPTKAADKKEPERTVSLRLKLDAERSIKVSKGFKEIYNNLTPKITALYTDKNGKRRGTYEYFPRRDSIKDEWVWDVLPYGQVALEVDNIAFVPIFDTLLMNQEFETWEVRLAVDSVLYAYQDGEKYSYLRGSLSFAQTFIVYFTSGSAMDNYDKIVELIPDAIRVQKATHGNAFYVTLPVADARTVDDLILEKKLGRRRGFEGYYLGPMVTRYIELLQAEPNVAYANPTFYNDPREEEMFNPKTTPKSDYLIKKQILQLTNDK